jgi:UDP-glucose 4-epimerase
MRVAVTGVTGLIGSSVAARLSRSHEIVRVGRRPGCDISVDLANPESVASLELAGCDALVHCAGVVDEDFRENESEAWNKSTLSMRLLVARAVRAGIGVMAYISTSHVYGPLEGRIDERKCPAPLSDYAIAHLAAERILARSAQNEGLRVLALRPNAVYGMPSLETFDRWNLIPYSFPAAAVYDHEIVLRSTGNQRRNFIAADDVAAWVEAFLTDQSEGLQIVNPVGSDTLSVHDFAKMCASVHQKLSGEDCQVKTLASGGRESGDDFIYASVTGDSLARHRVEEYIEEFILRLRDDWNGGRRYGS